MRQLLQALRKIGEQSHVSGQVQVIQPQMRKEHRPQHLVQRSRMGVEQGELPFFRLPCLCGLAVWQRLKNSTDPRQ